MTARSRTPLALVAVALALLGGGLAYLVGSGSGGRGGDAVEGPDPASVSQSPPEPRGTSALVEPPRVAARTEEEVPDTTVLWPLEIELELLRAAYLPTAEGVVPVGTGRTARLAGRITGADDQGARAEVRFVAGPNQGVVLACDSTGHFGSGSLYPGLAVVEVRGDGILGSRREVRLRQGKETLLNIGYGRPATVFGQVIDKDGAGLEGALVHVDGIRVYAGLEGEFYIPSVAAGPVLVEVEKPGYASYRESYNVSGGMVIPKERMRFVLQPEASMLLSCNDRLGGPGPVQVFLLPAQERGQRTFPWHSVGPIEITPGIPVQVDGLPNVATRVLAFRAGAWAPEKVVNPRPGDTLAVEVSLRATPRLTGRVTIDGEPAPRAIVRLEAPDQVRAMLGYFKKASYFLEAEVIPPLPVASQEVVADKDGYFVVTAWSDLTPVRYLEARSADNTHWAGRLVQPGEESVEIELEPVALGDSTLVLDFPGRWQGLPYELAINGTPYDPGIVPAHEELRLDGLLDGVWSLEASWHGTPVHLEETVELDGLAEVTIELVPDAIEGQDEEQWTRAGRDFPFPGR